ncbi:MAG: hypothetical protein AB7U48_03430 [Bauldia sp.]
MDFAMRPGRHERRENHPQIGLSQNWILAVTYGFVVGPRREGAMMTANEVDTETQTGGPAPIRYIKLGRNGVWAARGIANGELPFSHREVPHEVALTGDRGRIVGHLMALGRPQIGASSAAREVLDFYTLGEDAIWITFAEGRMWWTRAKAGVVWREAGDDYAPRIRHTIGGWTDKDVSGVPLTTDRLTTRLTKVASFRQTICRVEDEDYVRRKIAGEEEPLVRRAREASGSLTTVAEDLIAALHWADFETLIDIVLARGGWHRISALGGTMKDADLVVEQALTGETALVQVKSASDQRELDGYIEILDGNPAWSRMIYACHSPKGRLVADRSDVLIWTRERLAEIALKNGLFGWIASRVA